MGKMIVQGSAGRAKKNYHSIDWVGGSIRLFLILIDVLIANCVLMSPLAWILRDGLGPSAVESHGWQAVWRMVLCFYWGPILLGLVVGNVLLRIALRRRKGKQNDTKSILQNEHENETPASTASHLRYALIVAGYLLLAGLVAILISALFFKM